MKHLIEFVYFVKRISRIFLILGKLIIKLNIAKTMMEKGLNNTQNNDGITKIICPYYLDEYLSS